MCTHPVFLKGICILKIFKVTFFSQKTLTSKLYYFKAILSNCYVCPFFQWRIFTLFILIVVKLIKQEHIDVFIILSHIYIKQEYVRQ